MRAYELMVIADGDLEDNNVETVVRWVHSGFLGDNWEKEYEGLSEGDPMYFDKLRVYLTYFRGRKATPACARSCGRSIGNAGRPRTTTARRETT